MYIDGTGGEADAKTFLTSPVNQPPLGDCFMFYYNLFVSKYQEEVSGKE